MESFSPGSEFEVKQGGKKNKDGAPVFLPESSDSTGSGAREYNKWTEPKERA